MGAGYIVSARTRGSHKEDGTAFPNLALAGTPSGSEPP